MKSLTQIAYSCFGLILLLGCSLTYAENMDGSFTQKSSKVTEVVIPLSGQDIKKNSAGPKRGMGMKQVEAKYGKATKVHPTKGKPPITRWDYPEFSVYFESNSVIHTVSHSD